MLHRRRFTLASINVVRDFFFKIELLPHASRLETNASFKSSIRITVLSEMLAISSSKLFKVFTPLNSSDSVLELYRFTNKIFSSFTLASIIKIRPFSSHFLSVIRKDINPKNLCYYKNLYYHVKKSKDL